MNAQLQPRGNLEEFFPTAVSARQKHEGVGEIGHEGFSFMHRGNDVKFGKRFVSNFLLHERFGDDANGLPARCEHRVGQNSHQSNTTAPKDERDVIFGKLVPKSRGGLRVEGPRTGA